MYVRVCESVSHTQTHTLGHPHRYGVLQLPDSSIYKGQFVSGRYEGSTPFSLPFPFVFFSCLSWTRAFFRGQLGSGRYHGGKCLGCTPFPPGFFFLCFFYVLFVFVFVRVCVYLFMIYFAFTVCVCVSLTLSLCDGCRGGRNEHVRRGQVPRPVQAGKLSHTCTCTHTSMYARTHAREMRLCTYVHCIYICNNVLMCTPTPTPTHTHTHTHTICALWHVDVYMYTHSQTHARRYTLTHTFSLT